MRSVRRSLERGWSAEEQRREASAGARAARGKTDGPRMGQGPALRTVVASKRTLTRAGAS